MLLTQGEWIDRVTLGFQGWPLVVVPRSGRLIDRVLACDRWHGLLLAEPDERIPFNVTALRWDRDRRDRVVGVRRWCRREAVAECYLLVCEPWVRAFFREEADAALFRMFFDDGG